MGEESRIDKMRQLDFFRDYSEEHLAKLAAISQVAQFHARQQIFHEHDPAKNVYLIVRGKVSLVICSPKVGCRQIGEASEGELIGWSPLLGRPLLSDTATTTTDVEAIVLDGAALLNVCNEDHDLGYQFMCRVASVLAERLGATRAQLFNSCGEILPPVRLESD